MVAGKSFAGQFTNSNTITMEKFNTHEFPALPYPYDALEPYIDARTMEIHYDKHHRAYFNNFVNAIKGTPLDNKTIEDIKNHYETAKTLYLTLKESLKAKYQ